MSPGELLYAVLTASPAFQGVAGDRVFPVWLPQGEALPAVAYQLVSNVAQGCSDKQARVQVSLFARSYAELDALDAVVQGVLHGYEAPGAYIEYLDGRDNLDQQSEVYFRPTDYRVELSPVTS